jgi:hypothetical protein
VMEPVISGKPTLTLEICFSGDGAPANMGNILWVGTKFYSCYLPCYLLECPLCRSA